MLIAAARSSRSPMAAIPHHPLSFHNSHVHEGSEDRMILQTRLQLRYIRSAPARGARTVGQIAMRCNAPAHRRSQTRFPGIEKKEKEEKRQYDIHKHSTLLNGGGRDARFWPHIVVFVPRPGTSVSSVSESRHRPFARSLLPLVCAPLSPRRRSASVCCLLQSSARWLGDPT